MKYQVWLDMMSGEFLIANHFTETGLPFQNLSDHNFVFSNQDGDLVGHISFKVKKIICSPAACPIPYHHISRDLE